MPGLSRPGPGGSLYQGEKVYSLCEHYSLCSRNAWRQRSDRAAPLCEYVCYDLSAPEASRWSLHSLP